MNQYQARNEMAAYLPKAQYRAAYNRDEFLTMLFARRYDEQRGNSYYVGGSLVAMWNDQHNVGVVQ